MYRYPELKVSGLKDLASVLLKVLEQSLCAFSLCEQAFVGLEPQHRGKKCQKHLVAFLFMTLCL